MRRKCLSLAILTFLLASCNNANSSNNSNNNNNIDCFIKNKTTIQFLCLTDGNFKAELERMINEFKSVEPNVTVNLTNPAAAGNYGVLEKTVISGFYKDDYPDIVQCYPDNVVKYIDDKWDKAINLDPYLNNEQYGLKEEKNDYLKAFLNEGRKYSKEGTYSLPFCKSTELLYYNADVLLNLNLSTIDSSINNGQPLDENYLNNLTWEELFNKLCPAIKEYDATVEDIYDNGLNSGIFTYDSDENFFITLAKHYGYGYTSTKEDGTGSIDFNNEQMINKIKEMRSAKDNGYLQTRGSYGNYVSDLFISKKALFTVSSTAGLSYNYDASHPIGIGVAKLPKAEGGNYSAINQGGSVCILDHKDNDRTLASYLFWKHITNEKNSSSWAVKTGYMGIRNSSYQSDEYQAALSPSDSSNLYAKAVSANLKMISQVRDQTFDTALFRGSGNARTNVGKLLTDSLDEETDIGDIDELFASYAADAESYLGN